ncbi:TPA: hypothetical protein EYP66_07560 [Candidatus Poribacteria bacterium]|nr:hypothetical protein [Candidatus Poribacteria bacterium]
MLKRDWILILLTVGVFIIGCAPYKLLPKKEKPATETTESAKVATLQLELSKTNYATGEAIPVTLKLKLGKFDLLVPQDNIEGASAFSGLVLKTATGEEVKPNKPFGVTSTPKTLYERGEAVQCIPGVELKAHSEISAVLEDLSDYYPLTTQGRYSMQVVTDLKVYKEILVEKSPQVRMIEEEIASIRSAPNLPADAKQDAIAALQADLSLYLSDEDAEKTYLPLNSFRGSAKLQSNIVEFTIQ